MKQANTGVVLTTIVVLRGVSARLLQKTRAAIQAIGIGAVCLSLIPVAALVPRSAEAAFDFGSVGGFACRANHPEFQQNLTYSHAGVTNSGSDTHLLVCWLIGDQLNNLIWSVGFKNILLFVSGEVPPASSMSCQLGAGIADGSPSDVDDETRTNAGNTAVKLGWALLVSMPPSSVGDRHLFVSCRVPPGGVIHSLTHRETVR